MSKVANVEVAQLLLRRLVVIEDHQLADAVPQRQGHLARVGDVHHQHRGIRRQLRRRARRG